MLNNKMSAYCRHAMVAIDERCRAYGSAVLSLDFFDTLVARPFPSPHGVFPLVAEALRSRGWLRHGLPLTAFAEARIHVEDLLRQSRYRSNNSWEISLSDIYQALMTASLICRCSPAEAALVEVEAEAGLLAGDVHFARLMQTLEARSDVRIAIVSDTYFSAAHLRQLFAAAYSSLPCPHIVASSDHGLGKSAGLFTVMLRETKSLPSQVVHLGDHPEADNTVPSKMGILVMPFAQMRHACDDIFQGEQVVMEKASYRCRSTWWDDYLCSERQRRLNHASMQLAGGSRRPSDGEKLGHYTLGPVLEAFFRDLAEEVSAHDEAAAVLFVTREGASLNKWFQIFCGAQQAGLISSAHLEVSRNVVNMAREVTAQSLPAMLRSYIYDRRDPVTLGIVCANLGISVTETLAPADANRPLVDRHSPEEAELIQWLLKSPRFFSSVEQATSQNRQLLIDYVGGIIDKIAPAGQPPVIYFADVGWSASSLAALIDILRTSPRFQHVDFKIRYLVLRASAARHVFSGIDACGTLINLPSDGWGELVSQCSEIVEQLCMPPDAGSVVKLTRDADGHPTPVRHPPARFGPRQQIFIADVQQAVTEYLRTEPCLARVASSSPAMQCDEAGNGYLVAIYARPMLWSTNCELPFLLGLAHDENNGSQHTATLDNLRDTLLVQHTPPESLHSLSLYWGAGVVRQYVPHAYDAYINSYRVANPWLHRSMKPATAPSPAVPVSLFFQDSALVNGTRKRDVFLHDFGRGFHTEMLVVAEQGGECRCGLAQDQATNWHIRHTAEIFMVHGEHTETHLLDLNFASQDSLLNVRRDNLFLCGCLQSLDSSHVAFSFSPMPGWGRVVRLTTFITPAKPAT